MCHGRCHYGVGAKLGGASLSAGAVRLNRRNRLGRNRRCRSRCQCQRGKRWHGLGTDLVDRRGRAVPSGKRAHRILRRGDHVGWIPHSHRDRCQRHGECRVTSRCRLGPGPGDRTSHGRGLGRAVADTKGGHSFGDHSKSDHELPAAELPQLPEPGQPRAGRDTGKVPELDPRHSRARSEHER